MLFEKYRLKNRSSRIRYWEYPVNEGAAAFPNAQCQIPNAQNQSSVNSSFQLSVSFQAGCCFFSNT